MNTRSMIGYALVIAATIIITLSVVYSKYSYLLYGGIILGLIYYLFYYSEVDMMDVLTTMTPLSANKMVVMSEQTQSTLLGTGSSTVMGFFNIQQGDRTTTYIDKLRPDEFKPLFQVANNWYFEISHGPNGYKQTNARIRIRTKDSSGVIKDEIMELQPLPKQKWICIAVLRDGRRFDVIYDNKIVSSQRLQNYPVVIGSPLSVGSKGLMGSVIHMIISGRRLTPTEVERERLKYVDTANMVIESNLFDISFPHLSFSLFGQCPPGLPCDPITKPPRSNLLEWKTPYA
jgi:hypothetical protein